MKRGRKMWFGADYYPEHWPEKRWGTDARLMAEAGMNVVRLGEFSWSRLEPEEGRYEFDWLAEAMDVLAREGIRVVLGTPTAAPPKWLMDQHPDYYIQNVFGIQKRFGGRRHACYSNQGYRRKAVQIAEEMAKRFGKHPSVVGWQIDNEMGGTCYCDSCCKGFQEWLKKKYRSIDALNEAWGTVFWSQIYRSFSEIEPPRYNGCDGFYEGYLAGNESPGAPWSHNPGLLQDYSRYASEAKITFFKQQADVIRLWSDRPVTHNLMGHYGEIDYYMLGKELDFVSWDNYIDTMWGKSSWQHTSMAHDIMRGIKGKEFWVMEQQSGPCGWQKIGNTPEPGQLRLWTYQAVAHGAEAVLYFRWRACLFGTEQNWFGVLNHDGSAGRRYREICRIGQEIQRLSRHICGSIPETKVLLVRDYNNLWSYRTQPLNSGFDYDMLLERYYTVLVRLGLNPDIGGIDSDFGKYHLILMPAFQMAAKETVEKCEAFVRKGGCLLLSFHTGMREWTTGRTEKPLPGLFRKMSGVRVEEFDSLNEGRQVMIKGSFGTGKASVWCDILAADTAEVKAVYESHFYAGSPAITENRFGKGRVCYVGCDLDEEALSGLFREIVGECGLPVSLAEAEGIERVWRRKGKRRYLYLLNHTDQSQTVTLQHSCRELLNDREEKGMQILEPWGVRIWMEEAGTDEEGSVEADSSN